MKRILFITLASMAMGGCDHSQHQHTAENKAGEFYGEAFDTTAKAIAVQDLAQQLVGKDTALVTIEGIVDQTCPNAGCWLNYRTAEGVQKITTDHVFFVPLEGCEGLRSQAHGKAFYTEISVEDQRHYAREEGKSETEVEAITETKRKLSFVATGVMIAGYKEPEGGAKTGSCGHDHSKDGDAHYEHEDHQEEKK